MPGKRGGKRGGAGRKRMAPEAKRRKCTWTISPAVCDALEALAKKEGITESALVDRLLRGALGLYDGPPTQPLAGGKPKESE